MNRPTARFCGECASALGDVVDCPDCGTPNPAGQRFCDACAHALPSAEPMRRSSRRKRAPALPPSLGAGRYQALRFIGEGARKQVFLAKDLRVGREVAVAVIKTEGLDEIGFIRVRREVEAMARLGEHPHIVTVFDIAEEDNTLYIVSQYMAGGDLDHRLHEAPDHRLSIAEVLRTGGEIARALAHAHAHGVIHRDLKPQNIWLTKDGTAKLGDFGLAVALDRSRLTLEGMMVGTVAYMAPEQALGGPIDARSDLYAFGALLYEMLCGRAPFVGEDAVAVISQHIHTPPIAPAWHRRDVPRALEELALKLLAKPAAARPASADEVVEVLAAISAVAESGELAVPQEGGALERLASSAFVGREREHRELRAALEEAISGRGRLVMLAGQSGIGKTRLAVELATYASLRSVQVLWGRCYEGEAAPAYWPWVQVIRAYVHDRDARTISSEMGTGAADIARVVSDLRDRLPDLPEAPVLDPEQQRFRLFDSIATFLRNAAATQPLAIVLDDLDAADQPSLRLLQFLAREVREARILLLGTYRDVELDRGHPLVEVLSALRRERTYERVQLGGLSREEVQRMLEAAAQHPLQSPDELALLDTIHRETEGNPYFIEELVRHLVETGGVYYRDGVWVSDARRISELGIPEGVRDVIGRRLDRLDPQTRGLLGVGSVIGRELRFETLDAVGDVHGEELVERLEQAIDAGILEEVAGELGRYRFSAAVIRDALYEELPTSRRLALHRRIGEDLERLHCDSIDSHLPELAHHFGSAARTGDTAKAVDYARRAGRRAADLLAYEEAARHYERALALLERDPTADSDRRADLMLALGDAQWRAGDMGPAKATFQRVADHARAAGDAQRYARAALGYGTGLGGFGVADRADHALLDLLHEALNLLDEEDSELRVRVLARLAVELYYTDEVDERIALSAQAVEIAERLGDTGVRLIALYSRHWSVLGPDRLEEQLEAATEIVRLARRSRHRDMEFHGHHFRLSTLLQLGEMDAVDAEIRACVRLAKELRQPLYLWQATVFRAMRALLAGRFDEGERLAQEARQIGERGGQEIVTVVFGCQLFIVRWGQGRLEEIAEAGAAFAERYPTSAWPAGLGCLQVELGWRAAATATLEHQAQHDFAGVRRDANWLGALFFLADVVTLVGDERRAAVLYDLLAPYADRFPTIVAAAIGLASNELVLGMLAGLLRRWDDAAAHFERALERIHSRGLWCWMPGAQREYARMLLAHGAPGSRERALLLICDALETARERGMKRMVEQLLELKLEAQGIASVDAWTSIDAVAESVHALHPDLRPAAALDGTVTLMFSDIQDSTVMTERLGDKQWMEVLRAHNALVRRHLKSHGGFEVRSLGDGFMIAFPSARRALHCAVAIQRALAALSGNGYGVQLKVRIGLHTGETIRDDDDFFGKAVVLAARIAAAARGGEVLVSSLLHELTASTGEFTFDAGRELELKGLSGMHRVYALEWDAADATGVAAPAAYSRG